MSNNFDKNFRAEPVFFARAICYYIIYFLVIAAAIWVGVSILENIGLAEMMGLI